jgi:nucleotide-binding universal stress UspA family protein
MATIMVPLDGSSFAEHAVPVAGGIARASAARIHLVQVHETPLVAAAPDLMVPYDPKWDATARRQEQEYLQGMANRIAERWGVPARAELVDGPAAMSLAAYAREMDIDMIVMTTHGRSGLSRAWLGSVADGVVRRSGVPVLALRPENEQVDMEAELRPRHVLIPMDGSDLSRGVLDRAVWLGSLFGARFTLLRVALPVPLIRAPFPASSDTEFMEKVVAEQRDWAQRDLSDAAAPLRERNLDVEVAVVSQPVPAAAILEYASTHAVDLIAIATHGRGGWSRLALGSVADKVLRGATMPVLLYRPPATNGHDRAREDAAAQHAG